MVDIKEKIKKSIIKGLKLPQPISFLKSEYHIPYKLEVFNNEFTQIGMVYCNINFDDQSPVYKEIEGRDYGGQINSGISKKLESFLQTNPDVAITSFVIPNFKGNAKRFKDKFLLSNLEYRSWISYYNDLSKKYNIEFSLHGFFHVQQENPFFQSHTEFAFKNQTQALNCINNGIDVFKQIGWPVTGFRQPGWDISSTINLPEIAKNCNMKYIASNSYDAGYNTGGIERVSNYFPTLIDGIINFPQNIELDWPLDKIFKKVDCLFHLKALISIKAHFVDRDVCNCLTEENFIKLGKIVEYLRSKFNGRIRFATLNSIADLIKATTKTT